MASCICSVVNFRKMAWAGFRINEHRIKQKKHSVGNIFFITYPLSLKRRLRCLTIFAKALFYSVFSALVSVVAGSSVVVEPEVASAALSLFSSAGGFTT